jgi:hypothetical protein
MRCLIWCCCATLLLCSCGSDPMTPKSCGKPYEVLIVGDRDSVVYQALDADAEGLPQPEASFDISTVDHAHYNQTAKLARSIVIVNINKELFSTTRIRYEKDVYAAPQMIVYVGSPSITSLKRDIKKLAPGLRMLLTRAEMNIEIAQLKGKHNIKASQTIEKMFGADLWMPLDMTSSKTGKDFLWLSNNATTGMQNICIYSFPIGHKPLDKARLTSMRDSVMKSNIKGETDAMYMKTAVQTVKAALVKEKNDKMIVMRGLWEMEGDAMGGPFVAHTMIDSIRKRAITVEAFVYAPEMNKRNKIRQIEAALYTLKLKHYK